MSFREAETDGNVITSRGMGTSVMFAAAILEKTAGKDSAEEVLGKIVYRQ